MTEETNTQGNIDPLTAMAIEIDNLKKSRLDDKTALDKATAQMTAVINTNKNLMAEINGLRAAPSQTAPVDVDDGKDVALTSFKKYLGVR